MPNTSEDINAINLINSKLSHITISVIKRRHWRYSKNRRIRLNNPSTILHLTNINDTVSKDMLHYLLSLFIEPVRLEQIMNNKKEEKVMYLAEYETLG